MEKIIKQKTTPLFSLFITLLLVISIITECYSLYRSNFLIYKVSRLLIIPLLFIIVVDIKNINRIKKIFYFSLLFTFIADILTLDNIKPYYNIGMLMYMISFMLVGIGTLKLRKSKIKNEKILRYVLATMCFGFILTNFVVTEFISHGYILFLATYMFMLYQTINLKKERKYLGKKYFTPFSLLAIVSIICFAFTQIRPSGMLTCFLLLLNGLSYFFLGMGIKNISKGIAVKTNK